MCTEAAERRVFVAGLEAMRRGVEGAASSAAFEPGPSSGAVTEADQVLVQAMELGQEMRKTADAIERETLWDRNYIKVYCCVTSLPSLLLSFLFFFSSIVVLDKRMVESLHASSARVRARANKPPLVCFLWIFSARRCSFRPRFVLSCPTCLRSPHAAFFYFPRIFFFRRPFVPLSNGHLSRTCDLS